MENLLDKSELMVGDWVLITDFPLMGMRKRMTIEHFVRSHCKFEPIKLTNEILEKNGFVNDGNDWFFGKIPNRLTVSYITAGFFGVSYHGEPDEYFTTFKYVHELQHILKVCKIKLDIEL